MRTLPLDPSLTGRRRVGAKAGFDLTWPFGSGARLEMRVPAPPTLRRQALSLGRGRARRRPEILRGADGRGGQPRRPRGRARARSAARQAWRSIATAKGAISSSQNSAIKRDSGRKRREVERRMLQRSVLACLRRARCVAGRRPRRARRKTTIKIGIARSISNAAELMAIEKGYFKEAGIKLANGTTSTPPPTSIALLAQNQLQDRRRRHLGRLLQCAGKEPADHHRRDRVSTPIGHNLMLRPDLKDTDQEPRRISRARSSPATARARCRPTRSARCWKRDGPDHRRRRPQDHPVHPDGDRLRQQGDRRRDRDPAVRLRTVKAGHRDPVRRASTSWSSRSR